MDHYNKLAKEKKKFLCIKMTLQERRHGQMVRALNFGTEGCGFKPGLGQWLEN